MELQVGQVIKSGILCVILTYIQIRNMKENAHTHNVGWKKRSICKSMTEDL